MSQTRTFRDQLALYFRQHPNVWIDGDSLGKIGGKYAWRSRVSDCRRELKMTIENRQRVERTHEDDCPGLLAWDIPEACQCDQEKRYTVSEYRYVPAQDEAVPVLRGHDVNVFGLT